ncbi:MAG: pyridoxamine kinase [Bacteroidales bacterium]|nr:pyridoxamine kinase [Bacteroidales bacterium]
MSHNNQKKIALINDFCGFGRCSIAVALPIISKMKVQCCPLPTSIFSNHTGFQSFYYEDFTPHMTNYIDEWKKLNLSFSGICTGFLGSVNQIKIVKNFISEFKNSGTVVIIDPVMGDYGKPYPTYTEEMCQGMKELVHFADIITPNVTEACILTDTPYQRNFSKSDIIFLAQKIASKGPKKVVITGVPQKSYIGNLVYEEGVEPRMIRNHKIGTERSGTGDIFSAIVAADAVNGVSFGESIEKASHFVKKCIARSIELDIPLTDGVCFEEVLDTLK